MNNFVVIEEGNFEYPCVGVIVNVINTSSGHKMFHEKLIEMCTEHFDADCKLVEIEDSLFGYFGATKAKINVEDIGVYDLLIYPTVIY
jgi:hypothetical protein